MEEVGLGGGEMPLTEVAMPCIFERQRPEAVIVDALVADPADEVSEYKLLETVPKRVAGRPETIGVHKA